MCCLQVVEHKLRVGNIRCVCFWRIFVLILNPELREKTIKNDGSVFSSLVLIILTNFECFIKENHLLDSIITWKLPCDNKYFNYIWRNSHSLMVIWMYNSLYKWAKIESSNNDEITKTSLKLIISLPLKMFDLTWMYCILHVL